MAKRWLIGGLAVGVGALLVTPEARTWLRRRLGLQPEDRRWFEEEGAGAPEYEGDEPLDTRESRFSLRARLSEEVHEPVPAAAEDEPVAAEPEPEPVAHEAAPEPAAEEPAEDVAAESEPGPAPHLSAVTPLSEPALDPEPEPAAEERAPEPEPEPEPERAPYLSAVTPEPWQRSPDAEPEPELAPEPERAEAHEPEPAPSAPSAPAPTHWPAPYESVPSIAPEVDAPKTPGEDTDEVAPLPGAESREGSEGPLTPPTELRPPAPPPSRPFSSEGASFRSAIDAARERVHGAAREATPDEGDAEPGEQSD